MPGSGIPILARGANAPGGSGRMPMAHWRAIGTSAGLFAAGFGAMNLFWWLGHWRTDVPGLWDYRSATIGDGLLLPIAAGILVGAGDQLHRAKREILAVAAAGLLGALAGGWVQWASWHDPHPEINWTSPAAHTLNAAGWYHAGLLVTVSGLFAGLIMRVLWRARDCRRTPACGETLTLRRPATTVVIACLLGFLGLLIVDLQRIRGTATGTAVLGTSVAAAMLAATLLGWGYGRATVHAWRYIGAGIALAIALCWMAA